MKELTFLAVGTVGLGRELRVLPPRADSTVPRVCFSVSETVSVFHGFDFGSVEQVFYLSDRFVLHHCLGLMAEKELIGESS